MIDTAAIRARVERAGRLNFSDALALCDEVDRLQSENERLLRVESEYVHDAEVLTAERDRARATAVDLEQQLARVVEFVEDVAKHGMRCDLHPTMDCRDVGTLYGDFSRYLRRVDDTLRSRAAAVLAEVQR